MPATVKPLPIYKGMGKGGQRPPGITVGRPGTLPETTLLRRSGGWFSCRVEEICADLPEKCLYSAL